MKTLYTAEALTTGDGRDGHGRSSDGKVDLAVGDPDRKWAEAATAPIPSNCSPSGTQRASTPPFGSWAARTRWTSPIRLWGLGFRSDRWTAADFGLAVVLEVTLPNVDHTTAVRLAEKAHEVCPYSNATRGNVDVDLVVTDD